MASNQQSDNRRHLRPSDSDGRTFLLTRRDDKRQTFSLDITNEQFTVVTLPAFKLVKDTLKHKVQNVLLLTCIECLYLGLTLDLLDLLDLLALEVIWSFLSWLGMNLNLDWTLKNTFLDLAVLNCNCFHFGLVGLDSDLSCPDLNLLCLTWKPPAKQGLLWMNSLLSDTKIIDVSVGAAASWLDPADVHVYLWISTAALQSVCLSGCAALTL